MKQGLIPGVRADVTFVVTPDMCPAFDGVVVHEVCATWTLVHQMEVAGRKILMQFLEPGEEGVGSHVSCDHLGPAPIGSTVQVIATATSVTPRELICDTVAVQGSRQIATGQTTQKIYPREVLERILKRGAT